MNRSGNCLPTMPTVSVSDSGPSPVGPSPHSSSAVDVLSSDHRGSHFNPLYDVSNEFMRVTGYTQQFKRLLSKRKPQPKRQSSAPSATAAAIHGVSFDNGAKLEKDGRNVGGLGSNHELHERTTFTAAAVALGGRRPPSPLQGVDGNGTVGGEELDPRRPSKHLGKQRSAYGRLWKEHPNFKHRLRKRKHLFFQRIKVSDFSLLFALAGIILTVLEAELSSAGAIKKVSLIDFLFDFLFGENSSHLEFSGAILTFQAPHVDPLKEKYNLLLTGARKIAKNDSFSAAI